MVPGNSSLTALAAMLEGIPGTIERVRDIVRAAPRGPWQIDVTAGYDRSLFLNHKTHHFTFEVDFSASREALLSFLLDVGRQAVVLEGRTKPLVELLQTLPSAPSDLAQHTKILKSAANAIANYLAQVSGYKATVNQIQAGFEESVADCEARLHTFLKSQPAGQEAALAQFAYFRSVFEDTLETIATQMATLAPKEVERFDQAASELYKLVER